MCDDLGSIIEPLLGRGHELHGVADRVRMPDQSAAVFPDRSIVKGLTRTAGFLVNDDFGRKKDLDRPPVLVREPVLAVVAVARGGTIAYVLHPTRSLRVVVAVGPEARRVQGGGTTVVALDELDSVGISRRSAARRLVVSVHEPFPHVPVCIHGPAGAVHAPDLGRTVRIVRSLTSGGDIVVARALAGHPRVAAAAATEVASVPVRRIPELASGVDWVFGRGALPLEQFPIGHGERTRAVRAVARLEAGCIVLYPATIRVDVFQLFGVIGTRVGEHLAAPVPTPGTALGVHPVAGAASKPVATST